jgi:hypothetical protein
MAHNMFDNIKDEIIFKRFSEKKSYRVIGSEVGISYTSVMNILNEYYIIHQELKPAKIIKPTKKIIKGHRRNNDNTTGEVADILVDGYAARIIKRFTNCGNPDCDKCKRNSDGKYKGHGPYFYLSYRDNNGSVITKYLSKAKEQELISKKLKSKWDIQITFRDSK